MFANKTARSLEKSFIPNQHAAKRSARDFRSEIGNQAILRQQSSGSGKDAAGGGHDKGCSCSGCSGSALAQTRDPLKDTDPGRDGPAPAPTQSPTAPAPAPAGAKKTLSVFTVSLPGSTRAPGPDIAKANTVWSQCSVAVSSAGSETWTTNVLDTMDPKGVLNEYSSPASPTAEETALLAHKPGGASVIHAYFVPAMSAGSRGEAFAPAFSPGSPRAVVISDSAAVDSLAHELGHVAMGDGGHSADPDNLMASGAIRNVGVDKLTPAQCGKV